MKDLISLSEYIQRIMREKGLTLERVAEKSRRGISYGYVNDLIQEKTTNPTVSKLQALALGLGVSEEEVFRVARGLPIDPEADYNAPEARLLEVFKQLPDIVGLELLTIATALLEFHATRYMEKQPPETQWPIIKSNVRPLEDTEIEEIGTKKPKPRRGRETA